MKSIVVFTVSLFVSWTAFAKTLVVSDIDDTLRHTNRVYGSYASQLHNIMRTDLGFSGMKELLVTLDSKGATIYYLTAAVEPLIEFGEEFLEDNNFPQDSHFIHRYWWEETEAFKVESILYLIEKEKPDQIILIGDNGEKDPAAYGQILARYPHARSYIHLLFKGGGAAPVPQDQFAYISSAEIAVDLEAMGMVSPEESRYVMAVVEKHLSSKDTFLQNLVLPEWSDITKDDIASAYAREFSIEAQSKSMFLNIGQLLLNL